MDDFKNNEVKLLEKQVKELRDKQNEDTAHIGNLIMENEKLKEQNKDYERQVKRLEEQLRSRVF